MLDLVRLRVLAAVAAHGSVTAAAESLHYTQPTVSHHLARLEAATGAKLVQRVGRGIRLTPEGEVLARRAAEIVGRVDAADAELASLVGLQSGRVRVGAFSSALSVLVPPAAAELRREHPNLELELADAHPVVAARQLRAGDIDLAILFRYDDEIPDDGLRYTYLLDGRPFPHGAGPSEHSGGRAVDVEAFLRIPMHVLVGERDVERDDSLRTGQSIDRRQGRDRLTRALRWMDHLEEAAHRRGLPPVVSFDLLTDTGHSFSDAVNRGCLLERTFTFLYPPNATADIATADPTTDPST